MLLGQGFQQIRLQSGGKSHRKHKSASQAPVLDFIMQSENVQGEAEQKPLSRHLHPAAQQEAAQAEILLHICEGPLRLDAAIHPKQATLGCRDFHLHCFALPGKARGSVEYLVALHQRPFAAACTDAPLLHQTSGAIVAFVDRRDDFQSGRRMRFLFPCPFEELAVTHRRRCNALQPPAARR